MTSSIHHLPNIDVKNAIGNKNKQLNNYPNNSKEKIDTKEIDKAVKDFTSIITATYVGTLFEGVEDPLIKSKLVKEIHKSMFVNEVSKLISENDSLKLSENIRNSLIQMQGVQQNGSKVKEEK